MVCGRAYHGGDEQPGCGKEFNWNHAKPYASRVERRQLPPMSREQLGLRGRNAFHPFTDCSLCGSHGVAGLRFRCIHCAAFDVCGACEPKLADLHDVGHVFEVVFESDFHWGGVGLLPVGTRVRVVRHGERLPRSLSRFTAAAGQGLEGLVGVVSGRRRGPLEGYRIDFDLGQGSADMAAEHLEPLLATRADAEALLVCILDGDEGRIVKGGGKVGINHGSGVAAPMQAVWQVELDGGWVDCTPEEQGLLQEARRVGQRLVTFRARRHRYETDLAAMVQRNVATNATRPLRERRIDAEGGSGGLGRGRGVARSLRPIVESDSGSEDSLSD